MNEPVLTIVGSLGADPDLRQTQSGKWVANLRVATTPRVKDGNDWKDGETLWFSVSVWGDEANNVAQSLRKGMRVIATGRLSQRTYQANDGSDRTSLELTADEVGASLKFATANVQRVERGQQQQQPQPQQGYPQPPQGYPQQQPPQQGYPQQQPYSGGY